MAHGLPLHVVTDAGKTQIARGSRTVLAIAGAPSVSIPHELQNLIRSTNRQKVSRGQRYRPIKTLMTTSVDSLNQS